MQKKMKRMKKEKKIEEKNHEGEKMTIVGHL